MAGGVNKAIVPATARREEPAMARVNPALIRQLNAARVFHAVRLTPGASQRRLSELTGLDKATISAVVGQLVDDGLLSGVKASSGRPGRPEVALTVAPQAGVLIGARLELGSVRLMAASLAGDPIRTVQHPVGREPDEALALLTRTVPELIDALGAEYGPVRALGVGVPALFDEHGALALAPNLGWRDVPVRERLRAELHVPVYVDNDTKAAVLAETLFGTCREAQDILFVAGQSGIGAALYLGGRLYRGHSGFAGELGHVKVRPGGRPCGCGGRGCLEAYASEAAMLRSAAEAGLPARDLPALVTAANEGDRTARRILRQAGDLLGNACADLVTLLNPERIVLGGAIAAAASYLIPRMRTRLDRRALGPPRARCVVQASSFGEDAVTMGGVALALEGVLSLPAWMLAREFRTG